MKFRFVNNSVLTMYIVMGLILLTIVALPALFLKSNNIIPFIITLTFVCLAVSFFIYQFKRGSLSAIIKIDEAGVEYSKQNEIFFLPWSKINVIGINADKLGRFTKNCYIYFDARDSEFLTPITEINSYAKYYFGIQYRKQVVKQIKKYWIKSIINLERVEF